MAHIGVHPYNTSLFVLSRRGTLESALPGVEWLPVSGTETPAALHEGKIDVAGTGSTPPLTALAGGADVVYLAISEPRPEHGSLVVHEDSELRSIEDLRGKRIGLGIGSYQSTLLVEALDRAGLRWSDVDAVPGNGQSGARAFETRDLDAWIGGDPHLADVQSRVGTRELVATGDLISNRSVWFARREFVDSEPEAVATILRALQETDTWISDHPEDAADLLAREVNGEHGLEAVASWEAALRRRPWGLHPVSDEFVAEQQRAADLLFANGQLPAEVTVADAVLASVDTVVESLTPLSAGAR